MSLPVSFKDFGSVDKALYREYCSIYREAILYLRSTSLKDVESGGDGGSFGRGGDAFGSYAARRGVAGGAVGGVPVKYTLPWRVGASHGGSDGVASAGDAGSKGVVAGHGVRDDGEGAEGVGRESDGGCDRGVGSGAAAGGGERRGATVGDCGRESDACDGRAPLVRGKHYEKNKAKRERAKALSKAAREEKSGPGSGGKTLVSVRAAHPKLDETWAERKVVENQVATAQLRAKLAKMEREAVDGTAEKRYKVEANLVQGQLDGAFALVPQQRVVSWAKTITSNGSSSTGSSGGKKSQASIPSVSSGLGSGSATTVSARERRLEEENERLKKQMVTLEETERAKRLDLGNGVDRLNRQHVSEVIALKQQLKAYQLRYG